MKTQDLKKYVAGALVGALIALAGVWLVANSSQGQGYLLFRKLSPALSPTNQYLDVKPNLDIKSKLEIKPKPKSIKK
jgi:hypothetical protein